MSLPITPETKIGALLEAYPGIVDALIEWVPAFNKLRNPILRKTVAKVATIEQAARVGGVGVRDLVRKLREATGQGDLEVIDQPGEDSGGDTGTPEWLNKELVRHTIDADSMLKTGVHPLGKVKECIRDAGPGEIVALVSAFRPEPLIVAMRQGGLLVHCEELSPGRFATYLSRQSSDAETTKRVSSISCGEGSCS